MASETDFLDMYRTLGLRPGCDPRDLRMAYRRYVARLHPDRSGGASTDPVAAAQLQRLIAQYDAAMAFEREHGRLPGSASRVRFAVPEANAQAVRPRAATGRVAIWRRTPVVLALLAITASMLWWDMSNQPPPPVAAPSAQDELHAVSMPPTPAPAAAASAPTLSIGMSMDQVREIEGEPTSVRGSRWEYGPSWIRFENDQVVEWHNSPLHSLGPVARTQDDARDGSSASSN
ncbi:J domain-containing protein [Dyella soli]|uniref:J domain-containing protein n=1 Tax=Dyella soli TaxID=522319 RepID=A0A4R0YU63_9GAMM|nr:J domain-containing protein [Dyella soli]TCI10443.1 J domain-containing protein [Dyella soli]